MARIPRTRNRTYPYENGEPSPSLENFKECLEDQNMEELQIGLSTTMRMQDLESIEEIGKTVENMQDIYQKIYET